jgi:DHA1 family bicyclomycin/chloramphenicol resistance-like MFS transporter
VLAPTFGQGVLLVGTWRHIFIILAVYGMALALWGWLRVPETLAEENRQPLSVAQAGRAARETLGGRASLGNTIASTLAFGGLFAYIGSIQQIVFDVFGRPELIGLVFALCAGPMAAASYANSRLVMRLGPRRLLLRALTGITTIAALHLGVVLTSGESLWAFVVMQALTMALFGLVGANASALAMAPLGHIAGTASALQGTIGTIGGALIGLIVGQSFDGTTLPLVAGFAACGGLALLVALWANPKMKAAPVEAARPEVYEVDTTSHRDASRL